MNPQAIILCYTALAALAIPLQNSSATEINRAAPDCALTSITDTQRHNLQQLKGKVVYVDFWASWCGPCAQSFPFMNDLDHEFKTKGLHVLAVNLDENPADAQAFLVQHPTKFNVATDAEQQCAKAFSLKAMPSSYLIDRNGVIRHEHMGFRAGEAEQVKTLIKQLLAENAKN